MSNLSQAHLEYLFSRSWLKQVLQETLYWSGLVIAASPWWVGLWVMINWVLSNA